MLDNFTKVKIQTHDSQDILYYKNFPYELDSTKRTLIFNYGLVCSHHHFTQQISHFQNDYNIIAHDYRGHYGSTSLEDYSDLTFKNICLDINGIINKESIKKPILIGHSMGVNVSLEYAKIFPQNVEALILISGTAQPVFSTMFNSNIVDHISPMLRTLFKKFPSAVGSFWKHTKHNPIIKAIVHRGGFNINNVSDEFIKIYLSKIEELGPNIFLKLLEQMNSHDIISYISQVESKTLIIGGDNDKVIPNYNQRILKEKLNNSELFIVKNGSHVPQVDFPNSINRRIELFIESLAEA